MQVSTALFQEIKNRLKREYGNTKYFTRKTLEIMLTDRKEAHKRFDEGENVNAPGGFWSNSNTLKTDFYNKNSGAYCYLLCILTDYKTA